ncbi:hypothetical protein FVQ98_01430 [Ottowia sp. GY511]|uniref:Glycosyltransferase RgtA/B/C/D-like domain-containing protein n=1 Tax=Ottowia flava TaxID=2675430 RepID=A0ABW4KTY5_9BURK|nr:hypothetical protein [Ottowia sp. GY511]TXK33563.1 hypothetical protein FVQ98_01430 [Ottowia sp. GY511]
MPFAPLRLLFAALRLVLLGLWLACSTTASANASATAQGAIDALSYDGEHGLLEIRGWAWSGDHQAVPRRFMVRVRDASTETVSVNTVNRPDLGTQLGDAASTGVGFVLTVRPNTRLSAGMPRVDVVAEFPDGTLLALPSVDGEPTRVHVRGMPGRHAVVLLVVALGIGVAYWPAARRAAERASTWVAGSTRRVVAWIAVSFAVLVALGVTGSSWQLLTRSPVGVGAASFEGSMLRVLPLRNIRTDEWAVLTPNVLAQHQHSPRFPVVNSHIGIEGQNMGVIGMTGAPIAQFAALARPATWGHFLLPLRQALSWQWQLPFFACLTVVWLLLNRLNPLGRGFNLAATASFAMAPYATAWSNWPLYAVLFPVGLLGVALALLRARTVILGLAWGALAGWLVAAWVLLLYPPWQVTVGTLMAFLLLGHVLDYRAQCRWTTAQWAGSVVSLCIAGGLLFSWWLDTHDAIAQLSATVYPGQRTTALGGDANMSQFLRGFSNAETTMYGTGPGSNQSEISAYYLLPWMLLGLGLWHGWRESHHKWSIRACTAFLALTLWYAFIGLPEWLAQLSQWGRARTDRTELAFALAGTALLALIHGVHRAQGTHPRSRTPAVAVSASLIALGSGVMVMYALHSLPTTHFSRNSLVYEIAMGSAGAAIAWWMMRGRLGAAVGMALTLGLITALGFNPLSLAPKSVSVADATKPFAYDLTATPPRPLRTLFLGSGMQALELAALGVPTVNGVFYYPHRTLWRDLALPASLWPTVNRYQHLDFRLSAMAGDATYQVTSPQADVVTVSIDPGRFDFSLTGAERVLAPADDDGRALSTNPFLTALGQSGGLVWFEVKQ